jgi:DNA-binding NtrC family response regulator
MKVPRLPDSTLSASTLSHETPSGRAAQHAALVVLWSRHEPHRMGEVFLVTDDGAGEPWIVGRGEASQGERRLSLFRQRPGALTAMGPIACPRLSRVQLRVARSGDGGVAVENVGRCPMVVNGRATGEAELGPGDVVELKDELLLLCTTRPASLGPRLEQPLHPFGEPDAFGLVGESPAVWGLRDTIAAAARRSLHTLVLGPSGAGKELVAQAIHAAGARAGRPFCARNAATIPDGLADAELFGNIRSYPNPGTPERPGLVGQADGGMLFLDEIAELPTSLQAHLLRVLDAGEYQRLGEATVRRSDFRLIAATNRPEASLKHDLLARLKVRVTVPGLDERPEDVPLLAAHLIRGHAAADPAMRAQIFADASPGALPRLSPALVTALVRHRYTTHVRELDGLLVAAMLESHGSYLALTAGARRRIEADSAARAGGAGPGPGPGIEGEDLRRLELQRKHRFGATACGQDAEYPGNRQTADLHLRQLICKALEAAGWDVERAAAILAGSDGALQKRARSRVETFLSNLEKRLGAKQGAPIAEDARRRALADWRGSVEVVTPVFDALEKGLMRGRRAGEGHDDG